MRRALTLTLLPGLFALAACDGGSGRVDAGSDWGAGPAVVLTVHAFEQTDGLMGNVGRVTPTTGNVFYALDITLEARRAGPLPVAPIAFNLTLSDGMIIRGDSSTNEVADGCSSRNVPEGESTSCKVVFELLEGSAAPETLEWTDGARRAVALVPT